MHEVLVNRLGGLSLPRKSVVRLTDRPDMTLDVYRGRKTTKQHGPKGVRAIEVRLYKLHWIELKVNEPEGFMHTLLVAQYSLHFDKHQKK